LVHLQLITYKFIRLRKANLYLRKGIKNQNSTAGYIKILSLN